MRDEIKYLCQQPDKQIHIHLFKHWPWLHIKKASKPPININYQHNDECKGDSQKQHPLQKVWELESCWRQEDVSDGGWSLGKPGAGFELMGNLHLVKMCILSGSEMGPEVLHLIFFFFKILFFYREGVRREKERERNISVWEKHYLPLARPQLGTWPTMQACALTRSWASDLSFHRLVLNPLSHTGQSWSSASLSVPQGLRGAAGATWWH